MASRIFSFPINEIQAQASQQTRLGVEAGIAYALQIFFSSQATREPFIKDVIDCWKFMTRSRVNNIVRIDLENVTWPIEADHTLNSDPHAEVNFCNGVRTNFF